MSAAEGDGDGETAMEAEKQRLAEEELAQLRELPLADNGDGEGWGGESVVGAEGVPQAIIEAERKSKPLRRWRLGTYALASSAAAAQVREPSSSPNAELPLPRHTHTCTGIASTESGRSRRTMPSMPTLKPIFRPVFAQPAPFCFLFFSC